MIISFQRNSYCKQGKQLCTWCKFCCFHIFRHRSCNFNQIVNIIFLYQFMKKFALNNEFKTSMKYQPREIKHVYLVFFMIIKKKNCHHDNNSLELIIRRCLFKRDTNSLQRNANLYHLGQNNMNYVKEQVLLLSTEYGNIRLSYQ